MIGTRIGIGSGVRPTAALAAVLAETSMTTAMTTFSLGPQCLIPTSLVISILVPGTSYSLLLHKGV